MTGPFVKTYRCPALDEKEILRYAGSRENALPPEARACLDALPADTAGRVVFAIYDIKRTEEALDLGFTATKSEKLRINLEGCTRIVLFAATAGVAFDRLIRKYERISPARALWYQSIGSAYVESVCDAFCGDIKAEYGETRPRFSPGYGDLPITVQTDVFAALQPQKYIGVTLGDNLFMTPTKSVTAIIGIK